MSHAYFGLICRHCKTAYPLGLEIHRDLKYMLDLGPFELECVQCGAIEFYDDVIVWESPETYSPALLGVSRERVRRAPKSQRNQLDR